MEQHPYCPFLLFSISDKNIPSYLRNFERKWNCNQRALTWVNPHATWQVRTEKHVPAGLRGEIVAGETLCFCMSLAETSAENKNQSNLRCDWTDNEPLTMPNNITFGGRAVFFWVLNLIWLFITMLSDWHFDIQSEAKPRPIVTRTHTSSRAFRQQHVCTSSFY